MSIERGADGRHNLPKLKPKERRRGSGRSRRRCDVEALDGAFAFEDHATPWSVIAPNLTFALTHSRPTNEYVGTAAFSNGTVQIQNFLPMSAAMTTRFILDWRARRAARTSISSTDGAATHVSGARRLLALAGAALQRQLRARFPRACASSSSRTSRGTSRARANSPASSTSTTAARSSPATSRAIGRASRACEFPDLHGSLRWLPDRFEVTHADADFYGGHDAVHLRDRAARHARPAPRSVHGRGRRRERRVGGTPDGPQEPGADRAHRARPRHDGLAEREVPDGRARHRRGGRDAAGRRPLATVALPAIGADRRRACCRSRKGRPNPFDPRSRSARCRSAAIWRSRSTARA